MIGYQYFRDGAGDWRRHHGALVPLAMPHALVPMKIGKARRILVRSRAPLMRWEEVFDREASGQWWHIIKDTPEDLATLSGNTRSKIRRGLKRLEVGSVRREAVVDEGYEIYRSAYQRYETFERMLSADQFWEAILYLPRETEFWAVRDRQTRRMVAFSENLVRDNACFYNTMWFEPEALKSYASYLLTHEMNKHYLNERALRYVSDGARNLSHETNIHEFLVQKFGFRRAFARLRVVYFPGFGALIRLVYPFRRWFWGRSSVVLQKVDLVLEQERIRRACDADKEKA